MADERKLTSDVLTDNGGIFCLAPTGVLRFILHSGQRLKLPR